MSRETASRYRITFAKTDHMRYTSHLDLQRTWERLMRRAELPLLFTEGFHPRPRFNVAAALPLGFTGDAELCDLYLTEPMDPDALAERLRAAAPPGVEIRDVEQVPSLAPAVQTLLRSAEYLIEAEEQDTIALAERVRALLAASSIVRERRGKSYDLRPLIERATVETDAAAPDRVRLRVTLAARPGATGRPDELLDAVGIDPASARMRRLRLVLEPCAETPFGNREPETPVRPVSEEDEPQEWGGGEPGSS